MSSKTEWKCDFCDKPIVSHAKKEGMQGYTMGKQWKPYSWTTNLENNYKGPHICQQCLHDLTKYYNEID